MCIRSVFRFFLESRSRGERGREAGSWYFNNIVILQIIVCTKIVVNITIFWDCGGETHSAPINTILICIVTILKKTTTKSLKYHVFFFLILWTKRNCKMSKNLQKNCTYLKFMEKKTVKINRNKTLNDLSFIVISYAH